MHTGDGDVGRYGKVVEGEQYFSAKTLEIKIFLKRNGLISTNENLSPKSCS